MALEKAKFIRQDNNQSITVQFNPSTLSITSNAVVSEQKTQQTQSDAAVVNMSGIKSRQLNMTLIFDTYQDESLISKFINAAGKPRSTKDVIDNFESFMNSSSVISFAWGNIVFNGFISNISTKYEMFSSDGIPVRASADITLEEADSSGESGDYSMIDWGDMDFGDDMTEEEMISKIMSSIV